MANLSDYRFMNKKNHAYIRLLWFVVYALLIAASTVLIVTLWRGFMVNPTVTTLESTYFPVTKVPFPAVALCEMNKISKKRATQFAKYLAGRSSLTEAEIMEAIPVFGQMYDFEYDVSEDRGALKIQKVLDDLDINLFEVLEQLTPSCDDVLRICKWKGMERNCTELFHRRLSFIGFCCIFNYIKKPTHSNITNLFEEPLKGAEGIHGGLTVTVNNDLDDYVYASLSSAGFAILIFESGDYPDQPSGSLSQIIATANTETFVEVVPTTIYAVKEVMKYPASQRQCLFDVERPTKFDRVYSQSDCNVECRINSTLALCNCVPFMLPLSTKENVCTLSDLECLSRYKNKWNILFPDYDKSGLLQKEKHDSLYCSERCYPSCEGTSYEISAHSASFHSPSETHGDHTIVHVFYAEKFSSLYKQDVVYYWFEILSNFGGTFGLVVGMSIVSLMECGLFWSQFLKKKFHK